MLYTTNNNLNKDEKWKKIIMFPQTSQGAMNDMVDFVASQLQVDINNFKAIYALIE